MESVSFKAPEETIDDVEEYADDEHDGNRSEALRALVERGLAYDDVERDRDRLERQLRQLIEQREEHGDLVEYVEEERQLQRRREQRERARETAPIWRRARWWITGRPDVDGADLDGDDGGDRR